VSQLSPHAAGAGGVFGVILMAVVLTSITIWASFKVYIQSTKPYQEQVEISMQVHIFGVAICLVTKLKVGFDLADALLLQLYYYAIDRHATGVVVADTC
jgi:hypothetical protein